MSINSLAPQTDAPSIPHSQRGDWTWELVTQFPKQGEWSEEEYLSRKFEGSVEYSDGVLDFIHPLYPPEEGGPPKSARGDWTWEMLSEFPRQGKCTERDYLWLPSDVRADLVDGCLEFRTMPTWVHAWIADWLHDRLKLIIRQQRLGFTGTDSVRVRTTPGQVREPDIVWVSANQLPDPLKPSNGAQLIMEVVSESYGDHKRDMKEKRIEYALAAIPEYWIVDPETETITILTLPTGANEYAEHGVFRAGESATSVLLPEFTVGVAACFAAGKGQA